jgi:hypothetical protein
MLALCDVYNFDLRQCVHGLVLSNHVFCTNTNVVHSPLFAPTMFMVWLSNVSTSLSCDASADDYIV